MRLVEAPVSQVRDESAIELYILGARLALLHACCFLVATASFVTMRVILDVPHPRAGAAAYLLVALAALAVKLSWAAAERRRLLLFATCGAGLLIVEGLLVLLVQKGGQGTLVAGVAGLLASLIVLTATDRRILLRG